MVWFFVVFVCIWCYWLFWWGSLWVGLGMNMDRVWCLDDLIIWEFFLWELIDIFCVCWLYLFVLIVLFLCFVGKFLFNIGSSDLIVFWKFLIFWLVIEWCIFVYCVCFGIYLVFLFVYFYLEEFWFILDF